MALTRQGAFDITRIRRVDLARLGWVFFTAALMGGCLDATQIEIELSTDVDCSDRPQTTIRVGQLGLIEKSPPVAVTAACNAETGRIGSLVILPNESKQGHLEIQVVAGLGKSAEECQRDNFVGGCIVARRSLNFVKHRSLRLPIGLEVACLDVPCGATQTCRKGECVSSQVNPDSCESEQGCMVVAAGGAGAGGAPTAGSGGTSGNAGESTGGVGESGNGGQDSVAGDEQGTAGESLAGGAGEQTGGAGGQTGGAGAAAGGAPPLGPVLVASDSVAFTSKVTVISPTKSQLPEHPGDVLFAWVCIASQFGSIIPRDNAFWTHYAGGVGLGQLTAAVNCEAFTATATGGAQSHDFLSSVAATATVQRLELAQAKLPLGLPEYAKGFPSQMPKTNAIAVAGTHPALVYFFAVSGANTLKPIKVGASAVAMPMTQVVEVDPLGIDSLTSGFTVASDQPVGTAPAVIYSPSNAGVWVSAGAVVSSSP